VPFAEGQQPNVEGGIAGMRKPRPAKHRQEGCECIEAHERFGGPLKLISNRRAVAVLLEGTGSTWRDQVAAGNRELPEGADVRREVSDELVRLTLVMLQSEALLDRVIPGPPLWSMIVHRDPVRPKQLILEERAASVRFHQAFE